MQFDAVIVPILERAIALIGQALRNLGAPTAFGLGDADRYRVHQANLFERASLEKILLQLLDQRHKHIDHSIEPLHKATVAGQQGKPVFQVALSMI